MDRFLVYRSGVSIVSIHAAKLESGRLQRVLKLLRRGHEYSTRELMRQAEVCAVNSCIAELRTHGYEIACKRRKRYFYYRLVGEPT